MNPRIETRIDTNVRVAGGMGAPAALQTDEGLLRRATLANLLWENLAYESGSTDNIAALVAKCPPAFVRDLVIEIREKQKLRHMPLFLIREMARLPKHKVYVAELLARVCTRPDMLTDFLALYWKDGKQPLSAQVKRGIAMTLPNFNEYQLAKYNGGSGSVRLRDAMFLARPTPPQDKQDLFQRLAKDTLATPDTWEVALSAPGANKKEVWERLLTDRKLGALALLRNLRNMESVGVNPALIRLALTNVDSQWLLPLNFFAARKHAPNFEREIEQAMLNVYKDAQKLPGLTVFVVDVSGSMQAVVSDKSEWSRMDCAVAMAALAGELCESVAVYATAGSDGARTHKTKRVKPYRGFALADEIIGMYRGMGGGGIFTRQALEHIKTELGEKPQRIIVFSDSQDCDRANKTPAPFGRYNYIVDVSAHSRGVNYAGVWNAEVSGWSENFLTYIAGYEGLELADEEELSNQ